jgi:uncharacterized membrane protein YphA (DoxX/SURF4 family)
MKKVTIASWLLRLLAAGLMLQTLYFKFTAQPESVYIFSQMGIEPWGRIATGIAELVAAVLLLLPATVTIGAALATGIMLGAVASHVFVLGIAIQNDHGQLFAYALIVLTASLLVLVLHRQQLMAFRQKLFTS